MSLNLPPLPYALDALEPHISRRTLAAHHGHHHASYVARTRALIQRTALESAELEELVIRSASDDRRLFNVAAQAWNHTFFWYSMRPGGGGVPDGLIGEHIERNFGSHSAFNQQFVSAASDHFGSGWIWLVLEGDRLCIRATDNAETPLVTGAAPLLVLDVWEHSYYLDYEHRRLDYIAAFLGHLVDWRSVNQRLRTAVESQLAAHAPQRAARH